ncbi:TcpQ domain-containing protein [uncultured Variovorax sp.]|uniref:TcpQ domain-containing protein n=1 Tax=uncultured Variovorax sp. TaxID=114708 RepID=UPI0025DDEA03|nr:TcpQ domain-containing protein [uncultured Variovorax sp.]
MNSTLGRALLHPSTWAGLAASLAATLAGATAGVQVEKIGRDMPAGVALPGPEAVLPANAATGPWAADAALSIDRRIRAVRAQWPVEDESLRRVIIRWAATVGVSVQWDSTRDYTITPAVRAAKFAGSFKDALFQLTQKYEMLDAPLLLEFSQDGTVLQVRDRESQP